MIILIPWKQVAITDNYFHFVHVDFSTPGHPKYGPTWTRRSFYILFYMMSLLCLHCLYMKFNSFIHDNLSFRHISKTHLHIFLSHS